MRRGKGGERNRGIRGFANSLLNLLILFLPRLLGRGSEASFFGRCDIDFLLGNNITFLRENNKLVLFLSDRPIETASILWILYSTSI